MLPNQPHWVNIMTGKRVPVADIDNTVLCNQVPFTDDEYDQLSYLLSMLRNDVTSGLKVVERLQPQARIVERLRIDQEMIISFINRIEAR